MSMLSSNIGAEDTGDPPSNALRLRSSRSVILSSVDAATPLIMILALGGRIAQRVSPGEKQVERPMR